MTDDDRELAIRAAVASAHPVLTVEKHLAFLLARLDAARARAAALEAGLREFCAAQSRMLDRWADADDSLRRELWRDLHARGDDARRLLGEGEEI